MNERETNSPLKEGFGRNQEDHVFPKKSKKNKISLSNMTLCPFMQYFPQQWHLTVLSGAVPVSLIKSPRERQMVDLSPVGDAGRVERRPKMLSHSHKSVWGQGVRKASAPA